MSAVVEHRRRTRGRGELGDDVARTISRLQARLRADKPHQEAVSALARLRRGIGKEPGFDYTLDTYLAVSDDLLTTLGEQGRDGEATDAEHAKHAAVTLYALHQQSQRNAMHVDGGEFGRAIGQLAQDPKRREGVRRRFAALGTAISFKEALYHLRGLTFMLREHSIPLDYGLLADDLRMLRKPDDRRKVQARWGREFFRGRPTDTKDDTNDNSDTESETPEETQS